MNSEVAKYIQQHWAWLIAMIVAVLCVICSISIPLWINKRRGQKILTYRPIVYTRLVTRRNHQETSDIQIFYKGQEVENVRLLHMEIRNSGGQFIQANDFENPVQLQFSEDKEVIDAKITSSSTDDLPATVTSQNNTITLEIPLLNQGEWLIVKALVVTEDRADIKVTGRIKGGKIAPYNSIVNNILFNRGKFFDVVTSILIFIIPAIVSIPFVIGMIKINQNTFTPLLFVTLFYGVIIGMKLLRLIKEAYESGSF